MLTRDELDRLIDAMGKNGVTFLDVEGEATKLVLSVPPAILGAPQLVPPEKLIPSPSPGIGRFAPRGADDGLNAIATGESVTKDEVLGYVTRGAVRLPILAPVGGRLASIAPDSGALIGHGDAVFHLEVSE